MYYCLGVNLVWLELWVLFEEFLFCFGLVWVVEFVEWICSNWYIGIWYLVVELCGG